MILCLLTCGSIACFTILLTCHYMLPFEELQMNGEYTELPVFINLSVPVHSLIEYDIMKELNIDAQMADINITCQYTFWGKQSTVYIAAEPAVTN